MSKNFKSDLDFLNALRGLRIYPLGKDVPIDERTSLSPLHGGAYGPEKYNVKKKESESVDYYEIYVKNAEESQDSE